jgi:hypothetical protein
MLRFYSLAQLCDICPVDLVIASGKRVFFFKAERVHLQCRREVFKESSVSAVPCERTVKDIESLFQCWTKKNVFLLHDKGVTQNKKVSSPKLKMLMLQKIL